MNKIYKQLSPAKFKLLAALFCLCGDLLYFTLAYTFVTYDLYLRLVKVVADSKGISLHGIGEQALMENYGLVQAQLLIMLGALLIFHLMMYFFLNRDKLVARFYVMLLSSIGCFGSLAFFLTSLAQPTPAKFLALIQAALYLFVAVGLSKFPVEETKSSEE